MLLKKIFFFILISLLCTNVYAQELPCEYRLTRPRIELKNISKENPGWIVITTAISSGAAFVPTLKEWIGKQAENLKFIHVDAHETTDVSLSKSYRPQDFDIEVVGAKAAIEFLKDKNVLTVITGSEPGVPLADAISEALNLKGNGTQLSLARRDKFHMQQALAAQGVRSIPSLASADFAEIKQWISAETGNRNQWPMVMKPLDSAGTDGFRLCKNIQEVKTAFDELINKMSKFGVISGKVLAQSYMPGEEYVVNTVSSEGHALVVEVIHYKKREVVREDGSITKIYDQNVLMNPRHPIARQLTAYAKEVLAALHIQHGPSHMEIMMTPFFGEGKKPVLIETGSRLMGGKSEYAMRDALGTCPLDLTLLEALNPEKFMKIFNENPDGIIPKQHVRHVYLITNKSGRVTSVRPELFADLPSVVTPILGLIQPGEKAHPTIDLFTSPGWLWLRHERSKQIDEDLAEIRRRELDLFETQ